mmetsp:Transcript_5964/g.20901  ORF Transcript_5964/g.20901 Transcript_5964/m.20901 type:complete len:208 (+) Transcript_5964:198-821(+)
MRFTSVGWSALWSQLSSSTAPPSSLGLSSTARESPTHAHLIRVPLPLMFFTRTSVAVVPSSKLRRASLSVSWNARASASSRPSVQPSRSGRIMPPLLLSLRNRSVASSRRSTHASAALQPLWPSNTPMAMSATTCGACTRTRNRSSSFFAGRWETPHEPVTSPNCSSPPSATGVFGGMAPGASRWGGRSRGCAAEGHGVPAWSAYQS